MKKLILLTLLLAPVWGNAADKRIEEVKAKAAAQGIALTFEMSPENFKYATGLVKPVAGKARIRKDKKFLKAEIRIPRKFHISELLVNTDYKEMCGIYDQGNCGSCVYNSIVKNFCDSLRLRNVKVPNFLSRQELMSCTQGGRCGGEWALNVMKYLKQLGGLHDEVAYPYLASSSNSCKQVDGVKYGQLADPAGREIDNSHKSMFTAILQGYPVSITVGADNAWMGYKSGIYNYCSNAGTNHEVLLYGWDCETSFEVIDGKEYCVFPDGKNLPAGVGIGVIPNSWSSSWGEKGEMRSKFTSTRGGACNNMAEEAVILETGIPVPTPKPPTPPTPPPGPTIPSLPLWVWITLGVLGLGVGGFAYLYFTKPKATVLER